MHGTESGLALTTEEVGSIASFFQHQRDPAHFHSIKAEAPNGGGDWPADCPRFVAQFAFLLPTGDSNGCNRSFGVFAYASGILAVLGIGNRVDWLCHALWFLSNLRGDFPID